MLNLNYLMDHNHILYPIFKIISSISSKKSPTRICINEIENRITSKIKTVYYLDLLTLETIKLLESKGKKIEKEQRWIKFLLVKNY